MGELRCVDGSLLSVAAVPCHDKAGRPYDVTLRLALDRRPFAIVGQRCAHQLATLAAQVHAARQDPELASCWPDPDDRFPLPAASLRSAQAVRSHSVPIPRDSVPTLGDQPVDSAAVSQAAPRQPGTADFQPGEQEYFSLRSRERGDLPGHGEVRCLLRSSARWLDNSNTLGSLSPGYWRLTRRAVLEAWGDSGTGVRAVLTSAELVTFLDTVLREPDGTALAVTAPDTRTGSHQPMRLSWPTWRQRGRVPDGSARSRIPALRAAARRVALAVSSPEARGSDVRR